MVLLILVVASINLVVCPSNTNRGTASRSRGPILVGFLLFKFFLNINGLLDAPNKAGEIMIKPFLRNPSGVSLRRNELANEG